MDVRAVLIVLLVFITTVKTDEGKIEFWRENVTLTCPQKGTWTVNGKKENGSNIYIFQYDGKNNGENFCTYDYNDNDGTESIKKNYYFYMKGKVCKDCYELDPILFGFVVLVDIFGTAFVMMIVYKCTKKKSSAPSKSSYKTPSRSGGAAPPTPSRDYETLNPHTRTQDTYSSVNRTG